MRRWEKKVILFIFIICFLCSEEIYGFLYQKEIRESTKKFIYDTKMKTLEQQYLEVLNKVDYQETLPYHYIESKVLYRNLYNQNDTITIYKGKNSGITKDNVVVNEKGLVGIVSEVYKNSSLVKLLPHKDLNISVKLANTYGVLKYENNQFIVLGINNTENVLEGDKVYTSDLSIYPENVFIGVVSEVKNDHYAIEKRIIIKPAVMFSDIKFVSVITDLRGIE